MFFLDKTNFEENGTHNSLVFQSKYKDFKRFAGAGSGGKYIHFWKSKGLFDENITASTTTDYSFNPQ